MARQFCHTKSDDWKRIWLTHKLGRQSAGKGSPVACKAMGILLVLQGFLDAVRATCAERSALACAEQRHAMPRRKNQWHCPAPGLGTRLGNLCEHEDRVGAAKTANRFISFRGLRGLTHVLRIVQTAAVIAWM